MNLLQQAQVFSCVRRGGVWVVALVGIGLAVALPRTGSSADKPDAEKRPSLKPIGDPVHGTADPVPPRAAPALVRVFVSSDAKLVCVRSKDGKVFVWDTATQAKAFERADWAEQLDFCGASKFLLVSAIGGVRLLDTANGKQASEPLPVIASAGVRALSADGTTLARYDGNKKEVQAWDTQTAKPLGEPIKLTTGLCGQDGFNAPASYFMLSVKPLIQSLTMGGHGTDVLMLSPDGKVLLTQNEVKGSAIEVDVVLWDVATGKQIAQLDVPKNNLRAHQGYACCFSPDGKTLATLGGCVLNPKLRVILTPTEVRFFDAVTGKATGSPIKLEANTLPGLFLYTPDGKSVLTQRVLDEGGQELVLHDIESGKVVRRFALATAATGTTKSSGGAQIAAFTPDGKTLITGSDHRGEPGPRGGIPAPLPEQAKDGFAHCALVWDVETGKLLTAPQYFKMKIVQLVVAPDGKSFWTATGVEVGVPNSQLGEERFLSEAQQWQLPERKKSPGESEKDKTK